MFDVKTMKEMADKFADLYSTTGLKPEAFTDAFQKISQQAPSLPKVTFNKNGYEIRTQVLEMAQNQMWQDYYAKHGMFETSVRKEHDEVVTKVEMPACPEVDDVLDAAKKFYDFVNKGK
tara:strand:+ start:29 stop:385 length:357 start_codon:yes stop_codon:yes gene_type:complete